MQLSIQESSNTSFGRVYPQSDGRRTVWDGTADALGAGGAVISGGARLGFFNGKVCSMVRGTTEATKALIEPAKQSKSLWNALKLNYQNFKTGIATWAKASNMPNFMKVMFTGKLGKAIGGVAAVFVFISGIGEITNTLTRTLGGIASPGINVDV